MSGKGMEANVLVGNVVVDAGSDESVGGTARSTCVVGD